DAGVDRGRRLEGAVAVAEHFREDGAVQAERVADDYVLLAVAGEVAGDDGPRTAEVRVDARGLEGAVAIATQEAEVVTTAVGDDKIRFLVAVEIADAYGDRLLVRDPIG